MDDLPVIDVGPLVRGSGDVAGVAAELDAACRGAGFFYVVGHGVDDGLRIELDRLARTFFALDDRRKAEISMARGGRAWRGWFPIGDEVTSGVPDRKEGLYFGAELDAGDRRVRAGLALHGPNLFPEHPAGLRHAVLSYLDQMTTLGHALVRGMSLGLGLDEGWFHRHLTGDPLVLFRIFHYPPEPPAATGGTGPWGVGAHTDYGLLTILGQDAHGGLQVQGHDRWIDVPPLAGSFVCNLGDMIERMTGGRYRATPHRVRNTSGADRLSFPFFFDPAWDARVEPILSPSSTPAEDAARRWDGASVHDLEGTYGDYLLAKVAKVFPQLRSEVIPDR